MTKYTLMQNIKHIYYSFINDKNPMSYDNITYDVNKNTISINISTYNQILIKLFPSIHYPTIYIQYKCYININHTCLYHYDLDGVSQENTSNIQVYLIIKNKITKFINNQFKGNQY